MRSTIRDVAQRAGVSIATVVSIAVHILILILFIRAHRTPQEIKQSEAAIRFVELIRSNPREFVEAPGPAVPSAPITAPRSMSRPMMAGARPVENTMAEAAKARMAPRWATP